MPDLKFRRARLSDTPAMLRITKDVWNGHDYVPFVWRQWLADSNGLLMAAVLGGELVGLQHIEIQPDNTAWLEGIRVAPELQGRGVGKTMLAQGIRWARDMGYAAVRLSTSSENLSSNRIVANAGLACIGEFAPVQASPGGGEGQGSIRVAIPADVEKIWQWVQDRGHDYYTEGWTAYRLAKDRLRLLLATNSVAVYDAGDICALAIATVGVHRSAVRVGLIDGETDGVGAMARWLRATASRSGIETVRGPVRAGEAVLGALTDAGYESQHDFAMRLHELVLK